MLIKGFRFLQKAFKCACECECERVIECECCVYLLQRVCVYVCEIERRRQRVRVCVCVCGWEREKECLSAYGCVFPLTSSCDNRSGWKDVSFCQFHFHHKVPHYTIVCTLVKIHLRERERAHQKRLLFFEEEKTKFIFLSFNLSRKMFH